MWVQVPPWAFFRFFVLIVFYCIMNFILFILILTILISAVFVVNTRNPVYSVFFLILTFLLGSIFLFLLRNEFLSIMFIVVYIGAIVVLFLFVIMMLNIKLIDLKSSYIAYIPLSFVFILLFFFEIMLYMQVNDFYVFYNVFDSYVNWVNYLYFSISNVHLVGLYLYTYYFLIFIASALILFIATIGSILLTFVSFFPLKSNYNKRHQYVMFQYFVDYAYNLHLKN